jgi:DNA-binding transcriptional LysR family regulator
MELRQLRYFVAVAEEMHFHRAAERLHIAQPALSQQIRRLEKELRTTLLHRTTRHVELTDPGRVLLPEARRVIADADYALAAVQHAAEGEAGLLRLGFVSSAALRIVPLLVPAMQERWPNVALRLQEGTTDSQVDAINEGRADVGIVREIDVPEGIVVQHLARERLVLAVALNHPLAARRRVRLAELAGERFVVFPRHQVSRLYDHIAGLCHRAGVRLQVAQEAVQFPTILGLVAARTGVAIVPDSLRALRLPGLRYITISDRDAYSTVSLIAGRARRGTPLVANCFETATRLRYLE